MPDLVERGYIYIAQPPLYKVKHNKDERYLKDDMELNQHMLRIALDNAQLVTSADGKAVLEGDALAEMARKYLLAEAVVERLTRVIDGSALRHIIEGFEPKLDDQAAAEQSAAQLHKLLAAATVFGDQPPVVRAEVDEKNESFRIVIERYMHGNVKVSSIDSDFLKSADYTTLRDCAEMVKGLITDHGEVRRGAGDKQRVSRVKDFGSAVKWLLGEANRGISLQRYKGLGEMNAEQLWETTMDASIRRLLKVQIEDAIAADQIFSTLMGDDVEPRRAFIEKNALVAQNIDV